MSFPQECIVRTDGVNLSVLFNFKLTKPNNSLALHMIVCCSENTLFLEIMYTRSFKKVTLNMQQGHMVQYTTNTNCNRNATSTIHENNL